jgi:hypothetical protein
MPIISTRSSTANITIRSGQAAVIGGILQDSATFNQSSVPTFRSFIRPTSRTPLKCLLSRSIKGKDLITYQNLVSEDYAQKSGKSRTIANKFGMYWYVTRANEIPRLHAEHLPGPPGTIDDLSSGSVSLRIFPKREGKVSIVEHADASKFAI